VVAVDYIWVGIGGFAGANLRYALGKSIIDRFGAAFPYATLTINLTGSFLVGVILTAVLERAGLDPFWRLLLVVGFLGGYTTFSTYSFEAVALIEQGHWGRAALYLLGSNAFGLLACFAGMSLTRAALR
jgi:CrcB protein